MIVCCPNCRSRELHTYPSGLIRCLSCLYSWVVSNA
jgi:ribosomal protein L37AE/L43A